MCGDQYKEFSHRELTSPMHDCIKECDLDILSGGADNCNCRSTANEWCMIECESIMADKSLYTW